jgi:FlaA1/EpsC-like NDP-sugar epimerase
LPDIVDVAEGKVTVSDLRPLDIEDLLGREPVAPHALLLSRNIQDKVVAVTGAGGSIGSELCRQILSIGPTTLLLIEMNEFALFSIHRELLGHKRAGEVELVPMLGSACNEARMREIFVRWKPHTVYHAAAYKHVPLVEHNIVEGVTNNAFGTLATALAARDAGVRNFVLISTDKAVRPTNVMGATKRLAEMVLQALAERGGSTRFSMVRFGNVLGSSGSVVPVFREQIGRGGPVTVTHPQITRFFMTVPEAAQLVIQAGAMATGGEVFVLDMGEPVRIADLARKMIELSGLSLRDEQHPLGEIELQFVGLRPGEKLYEELLIGNDPQSTNHPRIMKANEHYLGWPELLPKLESMRELLAANNPRAVRKWLSELVTDYSPSDTVVDFTVEPEGFAAAE